MIIVTEEMKQEIKQRYPTEDTIELANELGIKPRTAKDWARRLGVKKEKGHIFHDCGKFSKEQKKYIMENYSTMSNEDIAKMINANEKDILKYACAKGLKKQADLFGYIKGAYQFYLQKRENPVYDYRNYLGNNIEPKISFDLLYKSKLGKYYVNQDYFQIIDNEWKAYWLGFLYADGWVDLDKSMLGLTIAIKDEAHIKKFKESLQSTNKLYYTKPKDVMINGNFGHGTGGVSIRISNKKIVENLIDLGCLEHKTYCMKFPGFNQVPKKYMRHFIRGYFDGDGWVSILAKNKVPSIGFVGCPEFILELKDFLIDELNITNIKPSQKKNVFSIEIDWSGFVDVEKLFNYMYNGANIFLDRKFNKLNNFYCLGQWELTDTLT